jgi:hypothetical protein
MRGSRALAVTVALSLAGLHLPARAQGDATDAQARMYFDAGAKAYVAGRYPAAIQAFEQAYKASPKPGILFSMGQAYRKQYFLDKKPANLTHAIEQYRTYVDKDPSGKRVGEAAAALAELEPIAARLGGGEAEEGASPVAEPEKVETRLMVSSSTPGARVSIDGGPAESLDAPFIVDVKPGKHVFRVTAAGFVDAEKQVVVVEGSLLPQDVTLEEKPALLDFEGEDDAEVSIDGRFIGRTPFARPLEVDPGTRFVTVSKNGYDAFAKEFDMGRGAETKVTLDLDTTTQRTAAWVLLISGGVFLAGGIVLGSVALVEQNNAQVLLDKREVSGLTIDELGEYESARDNRDQFRAASAGASGFGGLLAVIGGMLYLFDTPKAVAPPDVRREKKAPDQRPEQRKDEHDMEMDMSAVPALGPTFVGAGVRLTF